MAGRPGDMSWIDIVWTVCWSPAYAIGGTILHRRLPGLWKLPWPQTVANGLMAGGLGTVTGYAIGQLWIPVAIGAAWLALGVLLWWHRRRKRRRALALLGAKSRALIAAMVKRVREQRKPSRVLRPSPVPS